MTAELLWHVQNSDLFGRSKSKLHQKELPKDLRNELRNIGEIRLRMHPSSDKDMVPLWLKSSLERLTTPIWEAMG